MGQAPAPTILAIQYGRDDGPDVEHPLSSILERSPFSKVRFLEELAELHQEEYEALSASGEEIIVLVSLSERDEALEFLEELPKQNVPFPLIAVLPEQLRSLAFEIMQAGALDFVERESLTPDELHETVLHCLKDSRQMSSPQSRKSFERVLGEIGSRLINVPLSRLDDEIEKSLAAIGRHANVDRSAIFLVSRAREEISMTHEWHLEELTDSKPHFQSLPFSLMGPFIERSERGVVFQASRVSQLPENLKALRELLQKRKAKSFVTVPVFYRRRLIGFIGLSTVREERRWHREIISLLGLVSHVLANALERKQTRSALEASEQRFRSLIENLAEGILYCNRDGRVIHVNSRFSELTGYSLDEALGQRAPELFVPAKRSEDLRRQLSERLEGEASSFDIELKRKDGTEFWTRISASPVRNAKGKVVATVCSITDISESREMLNALEESEEKYRLLVESSQNLVWSLDLEGRITFLNDAIGNMLGYTVDEMLGRPFSEFQRKDAAERDLKTLVEVLNGKTLNGYESEYIRKDGRRVWLSIHAKAVINERGEPVGASGTAVEITDQKKHAELLFEQKEFFHQVINTNPNLISARDLDGRFILANRALADSLGRETENIVGQPIDQIFEDPEFLGSLLRNDELAIRMDSAPLVYEEKRLFHGERKPRWLQTIKKPLFGLSGKPQYILEVSSDFTRRKRFEEILKSVVEGTVSATGEDFFRSLVHHLAEAFDASHALLAKPFNGSGSELETLALWSEGSYAEPFCFDCSGTLIGRAMNGSFVRGKSEELQAIREIEGFEALEASHCFAVPVKTSVGEIVGALAVFHDDELPEWQVAKYILSLFGSRAAAEIERMKSEKETIELERQLTHAQKMEAIGTLAAGVAHDLNNALGAVMGHLELLRRSTFQDSEESQSLTIALDGCSRATRLVEQLLGFSRQGKYEPGAVDVIDLYNDALEFLKPAVGKKIQLELGEVEPKLQLIGDKNQLQQVLMNLVINAYQAVPDGGRVRLEASTKFVRMPERFNQNATTGEYVVLSVVDNGPGIDPALRDKIFDPFFTTKPAGVGTGLGLSMVYGIMQNHSGWVEVESEAGEGSTFKLFLPRTVATRRQAPKAAPSALKRIDEAQVLVIDDEPFLVDLSVKFLERGGIASVGFTNGLKALEWFEKNHSSIQLIILDMKMPQIDGKSCFHRLRKICPDINVVILSGFVQDEAAQQVLKEGAVRFFQKPLQYTRLVSWVQEFLAEEKDASTGLSRS